MSAASSPPPISDPLVGVVLADRYRIERCLGAGGVGVVYEATHLGLGRTVAVKVLKDAIDAREDTRLRFEREAQILSHLSHPNVVPLSDYGVHDGAPYLVMERLRGVTVAQFLREVGVPPAQRARKIIEGVLRALAYAHSRGVLHRDLKPGNVFLQALPDDAYHVRLLDFGLAKVLGNALSDSEAELLGGPPLTRSGYILGTPAYMAPEQASGGQLDVRSDVYAAGVLFFELLTGRPPFVEKRRSDLLRAQMVQEPPTLAEAAPDLHPVPALEALVARALQKSPGERFQSAEEILLAVQALPVPVATAAARSVVRSEATVSGDAETAEAERLAQPGRERGRSWRAVVVVAVGTCLLLGAALLAHHWTWFASSEFSAEDSSVSRTESSAEGPTRQTLGAVEPLERLAWTVADGGVLDANERKSLRDLQRAHPRDPRPSLLIAYDATQRGWHRAALERYGIVLRLDPSQRDDTRVRAGLVAAVTSDTVGDQARGMVRELYGASAMPAVREAIGHTRGRRERRRLRALLRMLRELPDAGETE